MATERVITESKRDFSLTFGPHGLNWGVDQADLAIRIVRPHYDPTTGEFLVGCSVRGLREAGLAAGTQLQMQHLAIVLGRSYEAEQAGWDQVLGFKG